MGIDASILAEQRGYSRSEGLYAAPFTPFRSDGAPELDGIAGLADSLVRDGVRGAFICGSNGEGPNLTSAERRAVTEAWIAASANRLRIMVHVGHASVAEARELAAHAAEAGADAASAVAAFYFKPGNVEVLADCMASIAAGAPDLPFYYYHIPGLTGVGLDMVAFLDIAGKKIGNLKGIKYTASTLWEYSACLSAADGAFDVLFGSDEMLLPALAVGARAAIGSTYNFAAPMYLDVVDHFEAGDMPAARVVMNKLIDMVRVILRYPPIPAQREIMRHLGHDLGACRLPLSPLSDSQAAALVAELDAIGFWRDLAATQERREPGA